MAGNLQGTWVVVRAEKIKADKVLRSFDFIISQVLLTKIGTLSLTVKGGNWLKHKIET